MELIRKTIMILGASILQLPAIEKAKDMGLEVVAVDMNPEAIGFRVDGVLKEVVSTIDTPAVLRAAKHHKIDGIMTLASDMPMQTVAVVCRELGLVGISEDTALKATNKAYMRDALKLAGVPVPLYFRVKGKDAFLIAVKKVRQAGCQCIVKPADNSGSRGVLLLEPFVELGEAYDYAAEYSRGGELVVEEFMEGPEVSVETLAVDGIVHVIQITDKLTTGEPYFVEMGHTQPSRLDMKIKQQIEEVAIAANKAIGITNGPSHTEIIVTNDGPKIVELGARLGGDCITTHLVPLSTGVDMVESCIMIALGDKPSITPKWSKGSSIRYFAQHSGRIKKIVGVDEALKNKGIKQIEFIHNEGETITNIVNSASRLGFIIAQDSDAQTAEADCIKAMKKITIEID